MRVLFAVFLLIVVAACNSTSTETAGEHVAPNLVLPIQDIEIALDFPAYLKGGTYGYHDERGEYLVILDSTLSTLNFIDIFKGEVASRYAVDSIFDLFAHQYSLSLFIQSRDSTYILLDNSTLVLANLETGAFQSWQIDSAFDHYPEYLIYGGGAMYEFSVHNHILYCAPIIQSIHLRTAESRKAYYSYPSHLGIRLLDDGKYELEWMAGEFPKHLRNGVSFRDDPPTMTRFVDGSVLISYDQEHVVHVHEASTGNRIKSVDAHSDHFTKSESFSDDSISHMQHTKEYLIEKSMYRKVLHDPFRDRFYRQHWQGIDYERNDYEVNGLEDKPWSIIVLGSDYERETEVYFESGSEYFFGTMVPTSRGLLLQKKTSDKSSQKLSYGLFEL